MKGKKLLAGILSAAMAIGTLMLPVFADDEWGNNTVKVGNDYFSTLENALNKIADTEYAEPITIECKSGADVGMMTHGTVTKDIVINGNNAYVSGGEHDLGFDEKGDNTSAHGNRYLTKDVTVKVYNLNKIAAWGQRNTDYTINLEFTNCKDMNRIYFSTAKGVNNITLTDCSFDGMQDKNSRNTSIYSNSPGTINIKNCDFNKVAVPVNLNNKSAGEQTITISNCRFNECSTTDLATATNSSAYAAPIRILTTGSGATSNVTVKDAQFNTVNNGNGDILIGRKENKNDFYTNVTLNISGTDAEIQFQYPENTNVYKNIVTSTDTKTIKMAETAPTASWDMQTDSGYYMDGETKYGMMRFMFKTVPTGAIKKSGIKYISAKAPEDVNGTIDTDNKSAVFQGDIINIPDTISSENVYYAKAYIELEDGSVSWSEKVSCSVNWNKYFTDYKTTTGGVK